jgi:hypothetical protein
VVLGEWLIFVLGVELRMIGKVKKIYDDVKLYGTSCRVETSIRRKEVIDELEQILNRH